MRRLFRAIFTFRKEQFMLIEAVLVSIFFVQALRYAMGALYSRIAGASVVTLVGGTESLLPGLNGVVEPSLVQTEIMLLGFVIGLPLLSILVGRLRWFFVVAVLITVVGRTLMIAPRLILTETAAAEIALAGGLLYLGLLIRNRATFLPHFFIIGLGIDQIIRAAGNTLDPSWTTDYFNIQLVLAGITLVISSGLLWHERKLPRNTEAAQPNHGILPFWSGIALGGMLFLQLTLLALPNAIAGRTGADYTIFTPAVLFATLLPLVPAVRNRAQKFLSLFDAQARGWAWLIFVVLLLVLGLRLSIIPIELNNTTLQIPLGGIALVIVQFIISMSWWWFARPQAQRERNLSGLWLSVSLIVFSILLLFDFFTYEYAFVRDFAPPFDALNPVVPPLLRGFRGMGIAVILFAVFLATLPIIQTTQRIPWSGGRFIHTIFALIFATGMAITARIIVQPPLIQPTLNVSEIRVGTYNIHGGFNEVFHYDLEAIARSIEQSGANVILLQEVEAGRFTSFGVDQPLWLARRLGMDTRFFPTNEGLQGLAVLSDIPIIFDDGVLLTSIDRQTGLQRVQIRPDEQVINIYNTWLGLLLVGEDQAAQERNQNQQLTEIIATIDTHIRRDYGGQPGRTLLGGTFNNVPDSPLIRRLSEVGFNDPFAGSNIDLTATFVRTGYQARVDYIWLLGQAMLSTGNGVINSTASDHRLAFVGLTIQRGNQP